MTGLTGVIIFIVLVGFAFLLIIYLSISTQYVPRNDIETEYKFRDFTALVRHDSTLEIPVRNLWQETPSLLQVGVYPNPNGSKFNITNIKLFTTASSILTYSGNFSKISENDSRVDVWNMKVTARHNLMIANTTNAYTITIFLTNATGIFSQSMPFYWPIKTMDFDILTYLLIVWLGVIVSRYSRNYIKSPSGSTSTPLPGSGSGSGSPIKSTSTYTSTPPPGSTPTLNKQDYLWILISGVVALLIFSNFEQQVTLSNNIVTNIALAFGFGFGFDKVLQTLPELTK